MAQSVPVEVTAPGATRPRATPVHPVAWYRLLAGTGAVVVVAAGVVSLVRLRPDGAVGAALAVLAGIALIPLVGSPIEWFVHRFVYHQPVLAPLAAIFRVHTAHHFAFFPTWRYTTSGPARRLSIRMRTPDVHQSAPRNAGVRLAHVSWYLAFGVVLVWAPAWLATGDAWFLAGLVVGSVIVSNLFVVVHDTIHRPGSHRLVEAQPWFAFLDNHHYVHHVDLGANLNFLLPLGDWLFGTLRTTLTAEELARHGSLADAKARPLGTGERAKAVVS
jgi:hypothetical protein